VRTIDHDVGDVVARKQGFERAIAEDIVTYIFEQFFLLGNRHYEILERDDLVHDIADFLARAVRIETRELGEIDGFDQRREDLALGLVITVWTALLRRLGRGLACLLRRRCRNWRGALRRGGRDRHGWLRHARHHLRSEIATRRAALS